MQFASKCTEPSLSRCWSDSSDIRLALDCLDAGIPFTSVKDKSAGKRYDLAGN
jgi:hypothetical protein